MASCRRRPVSLGVTSSEEPLKLESSSSLGLLVLVGFVSGDSAGEEVTGDRRGC